LREWREQTCCRVFMWLST